MEDELQQLKAELAKKDEQIKLLSHNNTMRRVELQQKQIEELEQEIARLRKGCVSKDYFKKLAKKIHDLIIGKKLNEQ